MSEEPKNRLLVMVVDDNKTTVKLVSCYLYANGYQTVYALNGVDCLEKLNTLYSDGIIVDCLVSDVIMPRMNGYELAGEIKRDDRFKNIGIITAINNSVENQIKAVKAGADLSLAKPIEKELLIAQVKMAVAKSNARRLEALIINGSGELIAKEKLMAVINKTPYNLPEAWLGWKIEI